MKRNGEQIIDRIIGYLTLSLILLLCGLFIRDERGLRGFPFGWYHSGNVRFEWLILSLAVLLAVTVFAAVISAVIGGIIEPSVKEPKETNTDRLAVTTEVVSSPIEDINAEVHSGKKSGNRKIAAATHKQHEKKNDKNPAIIALSVAFAIFVLLATFFADDQSNYDDYDYEDTYDYDVTDYEDVISSTAYDALDRIAQGDYDIIYDLGAEDQAEYFEDLNISEIESFGYPYESEDDDGSVLSANAYILYEDGWGEDSDSDIYLAGVLVGYSEDQDQPDNAKVAGLSIYRFKTYDEYLTYYENEDDGTNNVLSWITPAECHNAGLTEMDGTFILNFFP